MIGTRDKQNRPYINIQNVKAGTALMFDGDFGCLTPWVRYHARKDDDGLFVNCSSGQHYFEVQAEGNNGYLLGVYAFEDQGDEQIMQEYSTVMDR